MYYYWANIILNSELRAPNNEMLGTQVSWKEEAFHLFVI